MAGETLEPSVLPNITLPFDCVSAAAFTPPLEPVRTANTPVSAKVPPSLVLPPA